MWIVSIYINKNEDNNNLEEDKKNNEENINTASKEDDDTIAVFGDDLDVPAYLRNRTTD